MAAAGDSDVRDTVSAAARATAGVDMPAKPLRGGWVRLSIARNEDGAPGAVRLTLKHGTDCGDRVEHTVDLVAGRGERILHISAPIHDARIESVRDRDAVVRGARLAPLGAIGLLRAALARDPVEALAALRWRIVGKKVRARNRLRRLFGETQRIAYGAWQRRMAAAWAEEATRFATPSMVGGHALRLTVVVTARDDVRDAGAGEDRLGAVRRVSAGAHTFGDVTVVASALRAREVLGIASASGAWDWLLVMPAGTQLAETALLRLGDAIAKWPDAAAIYGDSDVLSADGERGAPHFTPQWNEAYFIARDYVGAFAVSRAALSEVQGLIADDDTPDALLLAAAGVGGGGIVRIAHVLTHRVDGEGEACEDFCDRRRATMERHLRRTTPSARVIVAPHGLHAVHALPQPQPLVSLIVPTRDRVDLLKPCIEGLRHRTDYDALEIIIADNGSRERATLDYFAALADDPRVRVLDCAGPFNYAAINNRAVATARGSVVGFLNNDIEVMHPDWLAEMVSQALQPKTGAVGALLTYANGLVQHAGVVMGIGGYAGHAHRFFHPDAPGYMGRIGCQQYVAAVTAACLVVERAKFDAVGGFDAEAFAVAYNDVDLCLRLRRAGFESLYTPFARLVHKESASRVRDTEPKRAAAYARECAALVARWGDIIADDPYYHPALTRADETFSLD